MSLNYAEINTRAIDLMLSVKKHTSSIDNGLKAITELRVSQLNGCAYCIDLHCREARKSGIPQQKLDCLSVSAESDLFSEKELLAIAWAERVTDIATASDKDMILAKLLEHFSEVEVVDLTITISLMNCLNRLSISFGDKPTPQATSSPPTKAQASP